MAAAVPGALPTPMHFELHNVPPNCAVACHITGDDLAAALPQNPNMVCTCTPTNAALCYAPLHVDPNGTVLPLSMTPIAGPSSYFGNLNFALMLPPGLSLTFSVQAVCVPLNLTDYYTTNAYRFTTFQ